ncbi:MAG: VWA domain-containing protein [Candidatus Nanoarchaeia archaeon]
MMGLMKVITSNVVAKYIDTAGDYINHVSPIQFLKPELLLLIIPLLIFLIIFMRHDFVKLNVKSRNYASQVKERSWFKVIIFLSRLIVLSLIIIVLAQPFTEQTRTTPGNLELTVLIDNSSSMELYDTSFVGDLVSRLNDKIPVKTEYIGQRLDSNIGNGILANLEKDKNILVLTDGQPTRGIDLGDVAVLAGTLNASISAMDLEEADKDVAVFIDGPSKTIADVENEYRIRLRKVGLEQVRLTVAVDDVIEFDQVTDKDTVVIRKNYTEGYHKIIAQVDVQDHFRSNNVFYKTTHVIPKPKILLVSSQTEQLSQLSTFLKQVYDVDYRRRLPTTHDELDKYYSVVIDDIDASELRDIEALSKYLIEGNGLLTVGGFNSFENGNYKGSVFETLLPVTIGTGERKRGDTNIVLVIDISMSTGKTESGQQKSVDIEKALAISVLDTINEGNAVGAIAFNDNAYMVSDILPLYVNKGVLIDRISRLKDSGSTVLQAGVRGTFELLKGKTGSGAVVFITDGVTLDTVDLRETENIIKAMYDRGITTYVIGVGRTPKNINSEYLRGIGSMGGGFYMEASNVNRLKIMFGEPEKKDIGSAFELVFIDTNHFITRGLEIDAVLYGYNQVIPKGGARLLATTDSGEPALVSWRYGIGRVATLTAFSGQNNLGDLMLSRNAKLLTRTVNWIIADPERKNDYFIDIPDTRINRLSTATVKADKFPTSDVLEFVKSGDSTYTAKFTPEELGFDEILGSVYAVNYEQEYQRIGFNQDLADIVQNSRGKLFKPDEIDDIVKHVKSVSKRRITEKKVLIGPLLWAALLIFLAEVCVRRIKSTWFAR